MIDREGRAFPLFFYDNLYHNVNHSHKTKIGLVHLNINSVNVEINLVKGFAVSYNKTV